MDYLFPFKILYNFTYKRKVEKLKNEIYKLKPPIQGKDFNTKTTPPKIKLSDL